ncbi:MAG TPA: flagellar export chaperone FliS [Clostridia bacterium]
MAQINAYDQYRENSVYTASPEELTLMLYNGLVKFIMQAEAAIEEKSLDKANNSIIKAQDIITEFQATLNMKYEISKNFLLLYDYMYRRLVEANIKKDLGILEEVLGLAKEFRDTWSQAMKIARQQSSQTSQAKFATVGG